MNPSNQEPSPDDAPTVGVGGVSSGQEGATPAHETQGETGGSGGAGLTHGQVGDAPAGNAAPAPDERAPAAAGTALQSGARGAQDTRAAQAGGTGTGLGTPETGANQSQDDLPPARQGG